MFDAELARVYALALIAIARADGEIGADEGARLEERIAARTKLAVSIADLLLTEPIHPRHLAEAIAQSPFRGSGMQAQRLADYLIADGFAVILEKGHATGNEGRMLVAFAKALGYTADEVRAASGALARWIPDDV